MSHEQAKHILDQPAAETIMRQALGSGELTKSQLADNLVRVITETLERVVSLYLHNEERAAVIDLLTGFEWGTVILRAFDRLSTKEYVLSVNVPEELVEPLTKALQEMTQACVVTETRKVPGRPDLLKFILRINGEALRNKHLKPSSELGGVSGTEDPTLIAPSHDDQTVQLS